MVTTAGPVCGAGSIVGGIAGGGAPAPRPQAPAPAGAVAIVGARWPRPPVAGAAAVGGTGI